MQDDLGIRFFNLIRTLCSDDIDGKRHKGRFCRWTAVMEHAQKFLGMITPLPGDASDRAQKFLGTFGTPLAARLAARYPYCFPSSKVHAWPRSSGFPFPPRSSNPESLIPATS